jgi:hypothetical protein
VSLALSHQAVWIICSRARFAAHKRFYIPFVVILFCLLVLVLRYSVPLVCVGAQAFGWVYSSKDIFLVFASRHRVVGAEDSFIPFFEIPYPSLSVVGTEWYTLDSVGFVFCNVVLEAGG